MNPMEDEPSELLAGRDQFAVRELRHVDVDVAMIEPIANLGGEDAIEQREVDDHPGVRIQRTANCDVADVAVTVIALARAETEDLRIALVGPVGAAISVSGSECDAAS